MDKNEELQKWLNDDRYVHLSKLAAMWNLSNSGTLCFLRRRNIVSLKVFHCGHRGRYAFYDLKKCESAREAMHQEISYANDYENNQILVAPHELAILWGFTRSSAASFLNRRNIKPVKKFEFGGRRGTASFYDRAECERARPFINQPEQKEVEKVEEKQMELPEPKEQTPDIIPADTIDLFTMSELETELKNRDVELTAEVRAKINASDMPEMQHIATMLRGNAKTIAIRLSVLNDIAGQLKISKKIGWYEKITTKLEAQRPPAPDAFEPKKEESLKIMQLTTEQKKVFCIIKEMAASGLTEIRQGAVAKKLSSRYNIGYAGARVAVSRAVKNMEIKGYVARPSFGVVLILAEYIDAAISETRFTPKSEMPNKTTNIKPKYKLDLIMSRLEEVSLLRKEIAELKQMLIDKK